MIQRIIKQQLQTILKIRKQNNIFFPVERTDTFLGYKKKDRNLDQGLMEKYTTQLILREIQSYGVSRLPPNGLDLF